MKSNFTILKLLLISILFAASTFAYAQTNLLKEGFDDGDTLFTKRGWTKVKMNMKDTIKFGNPSWDKFHENFDKSSIMSLFIPEPSPNAPQNESFISPTFSSSGKKALVLTFYTKTLPLNSSLATMNVLISIDGGNTYDTVWKSKTSEQKGVTIVYANYWNKIRMELPAKYDNQANLRLAFHYMYSGTYGYAVYFDGLSLDARPTHDIALNKVILEKEKAIFTNSEKIEASLQNKGSSTLAAGTQLKMSYQIDKNPAVSEVFTLNADLPMDEVVNYTFVTRADLANTGLIACPIKSSVILLGANPDTAIGNNNSASTTVYHLLSKIPYQAEFSAYSLVDQAIWTVIDSNNTNDGAKWALGSRSFPTGSWNYAWTYTPSTKKDTVRSDDYLYTPAFRLQGGKTYQLDFSALTAHATDSNQMSIYVASGFNKTDIIETLLTNIQVKAFVNNHRSVRFTPASNGDYFFVFHVNNPIRNTARAGKLHVKEVTIKELATNDIAVKSVVSILKGNLTKSKPLQVEIANYGTAAITNLNFSIGYTINGGALVSEQITNKSIAVKESYVHTFATNANFSKGGKYEVNVFVYNTTMAINSNDTLTVQAFNSIDTLPYLSNNGPTYGAFTEDQSAWTTKDANQDGNTWSTYAYGMGSSGISGQMPWRITAPAGLGHDDYLYSRAFALQAGNIYELSYLRASVNDYGSNPQNDSLEIYWAVQNLFDYNLGDKIYSDGIKEIITYANSAADRPLFARTLRFTVPKDSVYNIAFRALSQKSKNAKGIDIAELRLKKVADVELALVNLELPNSGCGLEDNETIKVEIKNFGAKTATTYYVSYQIGDANTITKSFTSQSLTAGSTEIKEISGVNLAAVAKNKVKAWVSVMGDDVASNDTLVGNVEKYEAIVSPYSYSFTSKAINSRWAMFTENGDSKWSFDTAQGHAKYSFTPNADDYLASPCVQLDHTKLYKISFQAKREDAQYLEQLKVKLGTIQAVSATYTKELASINIEDEIFILYEFIFTPSTTGLYHIAFEALTDNGGGIYIKDLNIINLGDIPVIEAELTTLILPASGVLTSTEIIGVKVKNNGNVKLGGARVTYIINNETPVVETLDSIAVGAEITYQFVAKANCIGAGTYHVKAFVSVDGDGDFSNDTLTGSFYNSVSIENNREFRFSMYPNPSSGLVTIQSNLEIIQVDILNTLGQKVKEVKGKNNVSTLELSNLTKGNYVVQIFTARGVFTQKLIIK